MLHDVRTCVSPHPIPFPKRECTARLKTSTDPRTRNPSSQGTADQNLDAIRRAGTRRAEASGTPPPAMIPMRIATWRLSTPGWRRRFTSTRFPPGRRQASASGGQPHGADLSGPMAFSQGSLAGSPGTAPPLPWPCRNCRIQKRWRAHGKAPSAHMHCCV